MAFPADEFKRGELDIMPDKELVDLACSYSRIKIWPTLTTFQTALNSGLMDTNNYWIYFKEKGS